MRNNSRNKFIGRAALWPWVRRITALFRPGWMLYRAKAGSQQQRKTTLLHRRDRRFVIGRSVAAVALGFAPTRVLAANSAGQGAAEHFVSANIQRGFDILNDTSLSAAERRTRFAAFLLDLTDLRRVAVFLLGRYANSAPAGQVDAFVSAFRDYSLAVYQSYFAQYAGQTLKVTGSRERAPGDDIVQTEVSGGSNGAAPLEVDFRIRSDGPKPVLVDIAVAGIWLALAQQAEFSAVLAHSNGDISALIQHLKSAQAQYR